MERLESAIVISFKYFHISDKMSNDFYLRYYVGHKGKFGHEFLEFEFRPDGKLRWIFVINIIVHRPESEVIWVFVLFRYANNSNYKNDTMIRKEAYVHHVVMDELRRIIEDSEVSWGTLGGVKPKWLPYNFIGQCQLHHGALVKTNG